MNVNRSSIGQCYRTFLILLLFSNYSYTQTGPAGVGNSSNNIIWLDAHALGFPDGSPIALWNDQSDNGNNFSQAASSQRPLYNLSGISGIPSLSFDGANDIMESSAIPALESANITYFVVYDRTTTTSDMIITADYTSNFKKWRTYMNNGQNTILSAHYSPTIKWVRYTDPPGASFFSTHITPTQIRTYNQGDVEMTRSATYTTPSGHNHIYLGNRDPLTESSYSFTGEIAEVVIYNTALNDLERIMVENYIGAKYNMAIPTDHYAYQATHKFGLIGLGNDGTNSVTTAQGAGILELSAATDLSVDDYYVVAHTDFRPDDYNLIDVPESLPEHQRLERTWKLNETGETGTTTLTFKLDVYDFASSDSYRLLADTDGVFADATVLTGIYDGGTSSISFDVDLSDGAYFTLAGIQEILEIHSIVDGDWSSTATWDCTCIPSTNDLVYIDPATTVNIDQDAFVAYLAIESGGSLEMSADFNLSIKEDWDINGEVDFTAGKVSLVGSDAQTVSINPTSLIVTRLSNLLVDNPSDADVTFENGIFSLSGTFSPNLGNIVIAPSTQFIIESNSPTEGGRIGPIISPTTITGNIAVERFIPPGVADWRNLSSPVIGSTFDDWDPDLAMSGPGFPDGCASGPDDPCFKSVRYTNHSISVNVLNSYEPITNGRGFELFVGSDLELFDGTTLTSTGPVNSATDVIRNYSTGWTTIGNPYASPIHYNEVNKSSSISKYYYVYDAAAGVFQWYDELSGTSSVPEITANGLIATGQAVWIFATSEGTITYQQNCKSDQNATFFRGSAGENTALKIALTSEFSSYTCTMEIQESTLSSDSFDEDLDILHLSTGKEKGPAITMNCAGQLIRKNFIRDDGANKTFELDVHFNESGRHIISASNWDKFRTYDSIYLTDQISETTVNLKDADYIFNVDLDNTDNNRFTLTLINHENTEESQPDQLSSFNQLNQIAIMGSDLVITCDELYEEDITIAISNILGQREITFEHVTFMEGENRIALPQHLQGVLLITFQTGNEMFTKKIHL
jgi:hypothetical protein